MKVKYNLEERNSYSYSAYRSLIDNSLAQNKTTGINHSEQIIKDTQMNVVRLNRLDKTAKIKDKLSAILTNLPKQHWVVLSEGWCGDAAQNLPWINKMAEANPNIKLSILLRDENTDMMDDFLTDGNRSIPKLIVLDNDNNLLFSWGPRPLEIQNESVRLKAEGVPKKEVLITVHTMYAKDKGNAIQDEFISLFTDVLSLHTF